MMKISDEIKKRAVEHYYRFEDEYYIVKPSFPILYFGDLNKYSKSKIKIVTVGKNPSFWEFFNGCEYTTKLRFPQWDKSKRNFEDALNPYFNKCPYLKWFSSYECVLREFNATYGGKAKEVNCNSDNNKLENVAIHTDVCTPLATNPTWSKLKDVHVRKLMEEGFEIWRMLIERCLKPDIIITSFSKRVIEGIKEDWCFKKFKSVLNLQEFNHRNKKKNVFIFSGKLQDKMIYVIVGSHGRRPFGYFKKESLSLALKEASKIIKLP